MFVTLYNSSRLLRASSCSSDCPSDESCDSSRDALVTTKSLCETSRATTIRFPFRPDAMSRQFWYSVRDLSPSLELWGASRDAADCLRIRLSPFHSPKIASIAICRGVTLCSPKLNVLLPKSGKDRGFYNGENSRSLPLL